MCEGLAQDGTLTELVCGGSEPCAAAQASQGKQAASPLLYGGTDASLMRWHRGMAALMGWIETRTPVGEVAEVIGECGPRSTKGGMRISLTRMSAGAVPGR